MCGRGEGVRTTRWCPAGWLSMFLGKENKDSRNTVSYLIEATKTCLLKGTRSAAQKSVSMGSRFSLIHKSALPPLLMLMRCEPPAAFSPEVRSLGEASFCVAAQRFPVVLHISTTPGCSPRVLHALTDKQQTNLQFCRLKNASELVELDSFVVD